MKNYFQRLCELPEDQLRDMISRQKGEIMTMQRDLERMERALQEKQKVPEKDVETA